MSQIIGWEYYVSHFPVVIPESQFDAVERQAEVEYRKVVGEYMDIEPEDEKNAVFQICNFLYTNQAGMSGKAVSSVNNNGYSETYSLQSKEQLSDALRELIYDCIGTRLAGVF